MPNHKTQADPPPADNDRHAETGSFDLEALDVSEDVRALIEQLAAERDDAAEARLRALADLENYRRRARENEQVALRAAVGGVIRSLLSVLDHLDLALGQDTEAVTLEQFRHGIELVRGEFIRALELNGVRPISPELGDEFDHHLHQAVSRQPTLDHPPNTVVALLQTGFVSDETVLRPAAVVVSVLPETAADDPVPASDPDDS